MARARQTFEFKQEAVRLVDGGQSIAGVIRILGVVDHTLFNWVKKLGIDLIIHHNFGKNFCDSDDAGDGDFQASK